MGPRLGYLDKFTKKDFMLWKFKMETMLKVRDFWGFIDKKGTKPEVTTIVVLAAYEKKENYALNLIVQSLLNSQLLIM
jgi:hypothetical protein